MAGQMGLFCAIGGQDIWGTSSLPCGVSTQVMALSPSLVRKEAQSSFPLFQLQIPLKSSVAAAQRGLSQAAPPWLPALAHFIPQGIRRKSERLNFCQPSPWHASWPLDGKHALCTYTAFRLG